MLELTGAGLAGAWQAVTVTFQAGCAAALPSTAVRPAALALTQHHE